MATQGKPDLPSPEVREKAFAKNASLKVYQLYQLAEVINLASTRGAFRGNELSHVGALFDKLTVGVDQAFSIAKEETEAEAKAKMSPIPEETDEAVEDVKKEEVIDMDAGADAE